MSLEKTERVNQLLDLYEQLLTAKQKDIMTLYYRYDYSLSEIANELKVSRTAIFDMIKRTTKLLEKYECTEVALAAYNAGSGNVDKWIKDGVIQSDGSDIENIPFKETNTYVRKIMRDYRIYQEIA